MEKTHNNIPIEGILKWLKKDREDIESIFRIADNYDSEFDRAMYLTKGYCKEVLRRFLESKKKIEL